MDRRHSPPHLSQREERDIETRGRRFERSFPVGRYGDVEPLSGRRGDEITDVRLRTADLGKRDDEEDERPRTVDARRVIEPDRGLGFDAVTRR
jgi:hypothetical protein